MNFQCDTKSECATPCGHASPHHKKSFLYEIFATREFDRSGIDCAERHSCPGGYGIVRCNPVEEPAKVCGQCGADLANWKETLREEHKCFAPATDLTSPLRPPRGPALYRCTKAGECGVKDCNAAEDHTHYEPVHGPRECGFLHQKVECEKVVGQPPLQGVYFSGKAVEVLSMLRSMDPDDWDKLWGTVTDEAYDRRNGPSGRTSEK